MGMSHEPLYADKDEKDVMKQAMMWLNQHTREKPLAHWLYHYLDNRIKELNKVED